MSYICGNIPLALDNIKRIEQEVAKLRKAVVDGRYDPRSLVGDAVLVIEGQLRQARETLDAKSHSNGAKTVFIAHPISGDIRGNVGKVLKICAEVHTKDIIPVAPYLISLQYLNDEVTEDRELGMEANHECFRRGYVDDLWLFGDHISSGMWKEIQLAREMGIPIIPKTEGTSRDLGKDVLKK